MAGAGVGGEDVFGRCVLCKLSVVNHRCLGVIREKCGSVGWSGVRILPIRLVVVGWYWSVLVRQAQGLNPIGYTSYGPGPVLG